MPGRAHREDKRHDGRGSPKGLNRHRGRERGQDLDRDRDRDRDHDNDRERTHSLSRDKNRSVVGQHEALIQKWLLALPPFPPNYANLDPGVLRFMLQLAQRDAPPVYAVPPEAARSALVVLQAETRVALPPATVRRTALPVGPTGETVVWVVTPCGGDPRRTYRHWLSDLNKGGKGGERRCRHRNEERESSKPKSADRKGDGGEDRGNPKRCPLPGIVYVHGGGWELGSFATHERLVRELADGVGAVVVFVEYDRTPEARFSVALQQVLDTLDYLERKGCRKWGIDPARVAIAGDSAGGNLATVAAMVVATHPKLRIPGPPMRFPRLRAQLLFYPVTDYDFGTPSYAEFAGGPVLTLAAMMWFWVLYAGAKEVATRDPRLSPLRAPSGVLEDVPPAMVLTASNDVLRDQGEAYGRRLAKAGVAGCTSRIEGTVHDFAMLNGLARTKPTREGIAEAIRFLRKHLAA